MITYTDIFQFGLFILTLVGICHDIFKDKK